MSLLMEMVAKLRGYMSLEGTNTPGPSETSSSTPPDTSPPDQESTFTCTCICTYTLMNIIVLLVWMAIISYCVFFYMITVNMGPYTSTVSLLVFVVGFFQLCFLPYFQYFSIRQLHASREVINSKTYLIIKEINVRIIIIANKPP